MPMCMSLHVSSPRKQNEQSYDLMWIRFTSWRLTCQLQRKLDKPQLHSYLGLPPSKKQSQNRDHA